MPVRPTWEDLVALASVTTPALSNAIESFGVRPRNEGFAGPEIRQMFPELGTMVGYACTLRVAADRPVEGQPAGAPVAYWEYVAAASAPKIVVVEDVDPEPVGAFWGEVNSTVHKALGAVGTVTRGGVRDLEEVRRLGFNVFASAALVSHANLRLVDYGKPVQIGKLLIRPGELLHADRHGVLIVPEEIVRDLPEIAAEIERLEREILDCCLDEGFTPARLAQVWDSVVSRWPNPRAGKDRGTPGQL
jgi:4-hydroxy-4-methyl-2-oxoglutarate aldolase